MQNVASLKFDAHGRQLRPAQAKSRASYLVLSWCKPGLNVLKYIKLLPYHALDAIITCYECMRNCQLHVFMYSIFDTIRSYRVYTIQLNTRQCNKWVTFPPTLEGMSFTLFDDSAICVRIANLTGFTRTHAPWKRGVNVANLSIILGAITGGH